MNRTPILAALAATAGMACSSHADDAFGDQAGFPARALGTDLVFQIQNPQAERSAATLLLQNQLAADGTPVESIAGYTLSSHVLFKTDTPPAGAVPAEGAPGWFVIDAGSVAAAAELSTILAQTPGLESVSIDLEQPTDLRALPTDPSFNSQWHLKNNLVPIADINAEGAWNLGFTGAGVTVAIIEGGWQTSHPDLAANFNAAASQTTSTGTSHASSCAGVVCATEGNGIGGVGLAYGAMLSNLIFGTSADKAAAFGFANNGNPGEVNHIKSNSYGPSDNGRISIIPQIELDALVDATTNGRNGLGTIIVWAAGNGSTTDRIDYDPWASSRHTLAIGWVGDQDTRSDGNESGSSMLAVAHSSGNTRLITTTRNNSGFTNTFGGSSSACPLASGAIALMLEANPNLSWRDVQHIIVDTARLNDPSGAPGTQPQGWEINGAGHDISYDYGFGALDAELLVTAAQTWTGVDEEFSRTTGTVDVSTALADNDPAGHTETVNVTDMLKIESVELVVNATTPFVGDLAISITSPDGTESILAKARPQDFQDNYDDFTFTSLRHFDELSLGEWTVTIADAQANNLATWNSFELRIHGTLATSDDYCTADQNLDGILSPADFTMWLNNYNTGMDLADVNRDGTISPADFTAWLAAYNAGCIGPD